MKFRGKHQKVWTVSLSSFEEPFFAADLNIALIDACAHVLEQIQESLDEQVLEPGSSSRFSKEDEELREQFYHISDLIGKGEYQKALKEYDDDFHIDFVSMTIDPGSLDLLARPKTTPTIPTPAPTNTIVNNHTCVSCGNSACNTTEKSCWRCGHPIT